MTLRTGLALIAALSAAPLAAGAADYAVMGEDERALSLIERSVKTDSDGRKETAFYIAFAQPVSGPESAQVISSPLLIDCAGARYKVGVTTTFKADMTFLRTGDARYGWRDLVEDSPFSRAAGYACRGETLPDADGGDLRAIIAGYLARRAEPPSEPSSEPPSEPSNEPPGS